jgi:biopolymer transport protein ExbD
MPLDLPKAASAGETQTMFTVTIDGAGVLRANDQMITQDVQLRALAAGELQRTPDLRAVLSASSKVEHGQVMHVLDLLRGVGITKVAFGVDASGSAREQTPEKMP